MQNQKGREIFDIVDDEDRVIGEAAREECHGNPRLIHRTAHVVVINSQWELLLQRRSPTKDIQPGRWDTAVGGHLDRGESYEQGARREMGEELGLPPDLDLKLLFNSRIRNSIESENTAVFLLNHDGPFSHDPAEIDKLRFWRFSTFWPPERHADIFTPNLIEEIRLLKAAGVFGDQD